MGLIGNHSVLNKNPGRAFGGSTVSETRSQTGKSGAVRGIYTGSAGILPASSHPVGMRFGSALIAPIKTGQMASRNEAVGLTAATGAMVLGWAITGASTGSGTTVAGTGALIVQAAGSSAGSTVASAVITGLLQASGSSTGGTTNTAALTATGALLASSSGGTTISGTLTAIVIAGASYGSTTVSGTLTGDGKMIGSSGQADELSAAGLAAAVWAANAASNNAAGTMGEKLNDSGSASNPWTEVIETGLTAAQAMRLITAALAGKISGADGSTVTIRSAVADNADRIIATVDADGNRTAITVDLD